MAALKFMVAVTNGDLETVQLLLNKPEHGGLVNYAAEDGNTPLICACSYGHENIVRYLISKGARLNPSQSCNRYRWTPLMAAVYYGHCQIVYVLLQNISDSTEVNYRNRLCATALQCAARCNHIYAAELLIAKGADVNGAATRTSDDSTIDKRTCRSPLMAAVQHGHDEMTSLLISRGSNVNFIDSLTGWTPLMLAALNGHKTAVTILLKNGADCNLLNNLRQTALDVARKMRRKDIENELEPVTARRFCDPDDLLVKKIDLIEAAKEGNLKQVQELAAQDDFDVNETKEDGMTPLMWAAAKNQFRIALLLIRKGADVNLRDNTHGYTALMHAINSNHKSIICILILNGASIHQESHDKTKPFDRAIVVGDREVIRMLGAANNINEADTSKQNASWAYLMKTLQECLFQDKIDMTVRYNATSKELQLTDLSDNDKQGFKISFAKKINKLQYNFNRRIHLLNKRQPAKPQARKPVSYEVLRSFAPNNDVTSNSNISSRGNDMSTAVLDTLTIELPDQRKTTLLPLGGPSVNEWIGDIVTPIVPPFTPTTTLDFNTKQRELTDALLSTSPQESEYSYGSKRKAKILPGRYGDGQSSESSFNFPASRLSPNSSFNNDTNIRSSLYTRDACLHTGRRLSSSSLASTTTSTQSFNPRNTDRTSSKRKSNSLPRIGRSSAVPVYKSRGLTKSESDDPEKIKDWLEKLSLQQYRPILEEHEIDTDSFLTLTPKDLNEIGITQPDAQEQILAAVQHLKRRKERKPGLIKAECHDLKISRN